MTGCPAGYRWAGWVLLAWLSFVPSAHADFKIWYPDTQAGEHALEMVGDQASHGRALPDAASNLTAEFEWGVSDHWLTEAEVESTRPAAYRSGWSVNQVTWENLFTVAERGENWVDVAWFAEWGRGFGDADRNEITMGPVLRKDFRFVSHTANLFFQKRPGDHSVAVELAWETRLIAVTWKPTPLTTLIPGIQWYSQPGTLARLAPWRAQDERAGPQLFGKRLGLAGGALEWNMGVLVGMTPASPPLTLRWQLEYEIPW